MSRSIENLKVYTPVKPKFPDPALINTTGEWYVLTHISSSLAHYDHVLGRFVPLLADFKNYSSGTHTFTIKESAVFSDGSPITAKDVVASIKRLLIRKTSTHFPLWDYFEGCGKMKSFDDECAGLKIVTDRQVEIRLVHPVETFMLQMASPETGIWSYNDIDPVTLEIRPTKFSGPYKLDSIDNEGIKISINKSNPIISQFPDAPRRIEFVAVKADKVFDALVHQQVDVTIRSHNPYDSRDTNTKGISIFNSAPATLIYLHGAGTTAHHLLSRGFIETLWNKNTDDRIVSADSFLPFDPSLALSREEFLENLPAKGSNQKIRIGIPWTYLSNEFYEFIRQSSKESGLDVELVSLTADEWNDGLDGVSIPQNVDYILSIYAASERYPAVQLRYITGPKRGPDIDLKAAETPELGSEKKDILKKYQIALLRAQYAVPLFFVSHQITHQDWIDIGDQPPSDAEVELWRMTRK